jgi:hypothetical protein
MAAVDETTCKPGDLEETRSRASASTSQTATKAMPGTWESASK